MEEHSILYYLLILILGFGVLQGLVVGILFYLQQIGEKRANLFFSLALTSFSLTLLHNILTITGFFEAHPFWNFLPIYFTLAFPPLLFYYVKLNCYPGYHFQWSDAKHFILPAGQFLFFLVIFFSAAAFKSKLGRHFYNPFFGAFEQALYLGTFYAYLYFAHRYIRHKRVRVKDRREIRKVRYLEKFVEILFLLFGVHTIFVVADFICYEFFGINLRIVKPYAALGALSFGALVAWVSVYGIQVLLWGRRHFQ